MHAVDADHGLVGRVLGPAAHEHGLCLRRGKRRHEVAQHQELDLRVGGQRVHVGGEGVVVERVLQHLPGPLVAAARKGPRRHADEVVGKDLVDQDVDALARGFQVRRAHGVAADDDRAAAEIDPVAQRRRDRLVVDQEGGDLHAVLVVDDGRGGIAPEFYRMGRRLGARSRQQVGAVVGDPVGGVELVGGLKAGDHLVDAGWTVDVKRFGAARDPAPEGDLAEFADVVGVEVGEQHTGEVAGRQAPEPQVLGRSRSDVDQEHPAIGDHSGARPRALDARQRRTAAAEHDMKRAVAEQRRPVGRCGAELGLDRRCEKEAGRNYG